MNRIVARSHAELSYPPPEALDDVVTPIERFYVRDHLSDIPTVDPDEWRLDVAGRVMRSLSLPYDDLLAMPSREVMATLECAGNGNLRRGMKTAVGNAVWRGVSLGLVLAEAGLADDVREIVATGGDRGADPDQPDGPGRYERAVPVAKALDPDTLIAYAMNGERLTVEHGFPARLVVPGFYGMDSIKWLTGLRAINTEFDGFYQAHRYRETKGPDGLHTGRFIREVRVKSLVTQPADGAQVRPGRQEIRGLAWAGGRRVDRVAVSTDGGVTWTDASLGRVAGRYAWRPWHVSWTATVGQAEIVACATDEHGETQPPRPIPGRSYEASWLHRVRVGVGQAPDVTAAELEAASEDGSSRDR